MSQRPWSELSVEELLVYARAGEAGALGELFRRAQPRLVRWAERRVSPETPGGNRPSDIVQEAELKAFQKFASFEGHSEGEWLAWLKSIVFSRAADLARQATSQKRDESGHLSLDAAEAEGGRAPQRSPSQFTSLQEDVRRLLSNLHQLPKEQCEALSLFHLKAFTVAEVARSMGRSEEAVGSLMQRGLRTLRAQMSGATSGSAEDSPEATAARNAADAALLVYLRRREAGETVDPDAFAAGYPACAEELRGMLHWLERLRELRPPEAA
ncbi:sigma-70 family RNA polymerase sigma factor [Pyxidicoccus sp. 3LFB2]